MAEAEAGQLVREAEGFLGGRYAYDLWARGLPVPDWAWVNVLAHAPRDLLAALAATEPSECERAGALGKWQEVLAFLARQLLATSTRTAQPVERLQRAVALRLELEEGWAADGRAIEPGSLATEVLRALAPFRDASYS